MAKDASFFALSYERTRLIWQLITKPSKRLKKRIEKLNKRIEKLRDRE